MMKQMKRMRNDRKFSSIREMLELAATSEPEHISYRFRTPDGIRNVTTREFYDSVESLGASLTQMGFGSAHIACVGENSYPWIQTYLTVLMSAGVFVPLDKELPADNLIFLLNESDAEVVFCDEKHEKMLAERRAELPGVRAFICFTRAEDDGDFLSFDRLISDGASLDRTAYDALRSDPNALKDLVFTSGTTGTAKGVMLTEHNLCSGIWYGMQVSQQLDVGLSVLPYNHTYEAVCDILVAIHSHATLCINDSLKRVQENLKRYQPSYIYLVPAFAEHFYKIVMNTVRKQKKEKLFLRMRKLSRALLKVGIDLRRVIFRRILAEFGGNLQKIVCGGAPIRPEIGEFFSEIGISMTGGYGITECSPLVSVNDDRDNNYSTAGHRLACLEWRIDSPDAAGTGEICVKGDVVMLGYYKRPDLTAEVLRDGWFYTGDYGIISENDEVKITGRKKNIIVLNNGKNIYPEEIESLIQNVPGVTEVVVKGIKNEHGEDTGLSAEIYSEASLTVAELMSPVRAALAELPSYKQIARLILRSTPFQKTTTNKIKR